MRRTLLSCITFIFLSAVFSARLNAQDICPSSSDYLLKAVECERVVFCSQDVQQANAALLAKAECYKMAGNYQDAYATLCRIKMFAASPQDRQVVLKQKALCAFLAEDYDASIASLSELGIKVDYRQPHLRSELAAMLHTILVPAGYIYAGAPGEGIVSTLLNAGSIAWIVTQVSCGCYISGIVGGAVALYTTFFGAQQRTSTLVQQKNAKKTAAAKKKAVAAVMLEGTL